MDRYRGFGLLLGATVAEYISILIIVCTGKNLVSKDVQMQSWIVSTRVFDLNDIPNDIPFGCA